MFSLRNLKKVDVVEGCCVYVLYNSCMLGGADEVGGESVSVKKSESGASSWQSFLILVLIWQMFAFVMFRRGRYTEGVGPAFLVLPFFVYSPGQ